MPTDKTLNAETIAGMFPADAETFKGKVNEDFTITLTQEGAMASSAAALCDGQAAMVIFGKPIDLEETKTVKHPGMARKMFEQTFAEAPTN